MVYGKDMDFSIYLRSRAKCTTCHVSGDQHFVISCHMMEHTSGARERFEGGQDMNFTSGGGRVK